MSHEETLAGLRLEEKAALLSGGDSWHTVAVPRLGVESVLLSDGPHGLRVERPEHPGQVLASSHPATCFPTAAALASSWDPALLEEVGRALGVEARAQEVHVLLGPGVNIKRSPLCGRNFEYFSEDPHLAGELGAALVRGIQSQGVGTAVKHFAANNQETDRHRVSAEVDERTLREIYLPAFERVVTGEQPWTVMCAYNRVNGIPASEHGWLLTEVLREEWGFTGLVVSDWGAVADRVAALAAGLDLEMPPAADVSPAAVVDAVGDGSLPLEVLDTGVRRVLELAARARRGSTAAVEAFDAEQHHALARRAAARSAVLLRNQDGLLPLDPPPADIAVVGVFSEQPRFQGAGSSEVNPTRLDSPLQELRSAFSTSTVVHAPGVDPHDVARAVDAARSAAVVVAFLGLPAEAESEGFDRTHLDLPDDQIALIAAVAAVNPRVVVVLANGSAVRIGPWERHVQAVLECWLGGQAVAGAVADLLSGRATPGGRLAETLPLRLEDTPSYLHFPGDSQQVRYGEGLFVGYRGHDALGQDVDRPFGFGLSYTTFALGTPSVEVGGSVAGGDLEVAVRVPVTNTGSRRGTETVQVYVCDVESTVTRPERELRGFDTLALEPGETGEAVVVLTERAFAYWSVIQRQWVVEAGAFDLCIGTSSRDLPLVHRLEVDAPSVSAPVGPWSTLHEWLADEAGAAAVREVDGARGLLDRRTIEVVGGMPLRVLATFGMAGLSVEVLEDLAQRVRAT